MDFRGPKGWAGLVALAVFIGLAIKQNHDRDKAEAWPAVQGVVESARLGDSSKVRQDPIGSTNLVRSQVTYRLDISYGYEVGGARYTGHRFSSSSRMTSLASAQRELAKYAPGTAVTVHYDPANPADAMVFRQDHPEQPPPAIVARGIFHPQGRVH